MDKSYRQQLSLSDRQYRFYDIAAYLADHGQDVETVPYSVRVLLEEALRHADKDPERQSVLTAFNDWDNAHDQDIPCLLYTSPSPRDTR